MGVRVPNHLVIEFVTVDGLSSSSILICCVSTLGHKSGNDSVEEVTFVAWHSFFLTGAKTSEIFSSNWDLLGEQLEGDSSSFILLLGGISNREVKVYLTILRVKFGKL